MTKLYFDHTDAVFFSLFYIIIIIFFFACQNSDYPPDENSWIRTGTLNEYMSI